MYDSAAPNAYRSPLATEFEKLSPNSDRTVSTLWSHQLPGHLSKPNVIGVAVYLPGQVPCSWSGASAPRSSHGHVTHGAIPGSRLAIIPGTCHYPHAVDSASVERILVEFMADTDPGHISPQALGQLVTAGAP